MFARVLILVMVKGTQEIHQGTYLCSNLSRPLMYTEDGI